jgi:hypothetical protein
MTRDDLLLGGPGLDGYAYRSELYCAACGQDIIAGLPDEIDDVDAYDSERVPQPIFFGEHELPQHCAQCGEYLYGGNSDDDADAILDFDFDADDGE